MPLVVFLPDYTAMVIGRWSKTKISGDEKTALVSRILSLTELEFVLMGFVRWLVLLLKRTG
jgi:hypothetical protein